jgi:hypothetical protein
MLIESSSQMNFLCFTAHHHTPRRNEVDYSRLHSLCFFSGRFHFFLS